MDLDQIAPLEAAWSGFLLFAIYRLPKNISRREQIAKIVSGAEKALKLLLAWIPIRIAVLTHCQMNENPCSNQEIHMLFEHGFELENTLNKHCVICMTLITESIVDQTDHFTDAFFSEKVTYGYDIVTALWRLKVYSWLHFV